MSPALTGELSTTEPWGEDQGFVPEAFPHNLRELMGNKLQTFIPLWFGFVRTEKTVPLQTVIKLVGSRVDSLKLLDSQASNCKKGFGHAYPGSLRIGSTSLLASLFLAKFLLP